MTADHLEYGLPVHVMVKEKLNGDKSEDHELAVFQVDISAKVSNDSFNYISNKFCSSLKMIS